MVVGPHHLARSNLHLANSATFPIKTGKPFQRYLENFGRVTLRIGTEHGTKTNIWSAISLAEGWGQSSPSGGSQWLVTTARCNSSPQLTYIAVVASDSNYCRVIMPLSPIRQTLEMVKIDWVPPASGWCWPVHKESSLHHYQPRHREKRHNLASAPQHLPVSPTLTKDKAGAKHSDYDFQTSDIIWPSSCLDTNYSQLQST